MFCAAPGVEGEGSLAADEESDNERSAADVARLGHRMRERRLRPPRQSRNSSAAGSPALPASRPASRIRRGVHGRSLTRGHSLAFSSRFPAIASAEATPKRKPLLCRERPRREALELDAAREAAHLARSSPSSRAALISARARVPLRGSPGRRRSCSSAAIRGRVGGGTSARDSAEDRKPPGLPGRLAPSRAAAAGAQRGRRARPALRGRGVRARARRGDGLRPAGDRLRAHGPAAIVADGSTRWLIPPDDEDALVDAVLAAANGHQERRARGRRAQTASRRYDWAEIAGRFASL
jgi:hypothetical protein